MTKIDPLIPLSVNPDEMFPKVEKLLLKVAWNFHHRYPLLSFEEARSTAHWAFMEACQKYKPGRKMTFASWCYFSAWCNLKTLVMDRSGDLLVPMELDDELTGEAPPLHSPCLEAIEDLSQDAKLIVSMLLETPREMLGGMTTPRQLFTRVKKHFRAQGWSQSKLEKAHGEIKTRFQEVWNQTPALA